LKWRRPFKQDLVDLVDREALRLLLKATLRGRQRPPKDEAVAVVDDGELMQQDNSNLVMDKLRRDLDRANNQLHNQTRIIDRLQDNMDIRDRDIELLKREVQKKCEGQPSLK
jgi:hypothetical protein